MTYLNHLTQVNCLAIVCLLIKYPQQLFVGVTQNRAWCQGHSRTAIKPVRDEFSDTVPIPTRMRHIPKYVVVSNAAVILGWYWCEVSLAQNHLPKVV